MKIPESLGARSSNWGSGKPG
ncbi:hypothetical protein PM8797T_21243 [Gimesia maris DSM 8797]|nr:hypothetical protein PM8797T_21243 [Gimesia maris DSM 8797]